MLFEFCPLSRITKSLQINRPAQLAELSRSEFDPELFSRSMYVKFFVTFETKVPYLTFCDKMRQFFIQEMDREGGNRDKLRNVRVNHSPFLHSLSISSSFSHSLSIFSQTGCQDATICATDKQTKGILIFALATNILCPLYYRTKIHVQTFVRQVFK